MLFRDCCITLAERPRIDTSDFIGTYLTFSDLWPTAAVSLEDLDADFEFFDPQDLAHTLAQLGFLVEEGIDEKAHARNLQVVAPFFPDAWIHKMQLWLSHGKANAITHRYLVPGAMQQILLRRSKPRGGELVHQHEHRFGAFLLRMNQFTERDYNEIIEGGESSNDARHPRAAIFRQLFYNEQPNWGSLVGRYWALLFDGARVVAARPDRPQFDLAASFQELVGVPLFDGMAYFMLIGAYYLGDEKAIASGKQFLIGLDAFKGLEDEGHLVAGRRALLRLYYPWEEYSSRLSELCAGKEENWTQFQLFYEKPFIETAGKLMFPIDRRLLRARLTEGSYWEIVAGLSRSKARKLNQYFGVVVEWYATELVRNAKGRSMKDRVWIDGDDDLVVDENQSRPDIVFLSGLTLFVVEVTTVALAPSVAVGFDLDAIEKAYSNLWFRQKQPGKQRGKLLQLDHVIGGLRAGKVRLGDLAVGDGLRIVPVLVTLRGQPSHPLLAPYIRDLIQKNGLSEAFANNLQLIDLEDFEQIVELQARGHAWSELLEQKEASANREWSWGHFFWAAKLDQQRHELVDRWVHEAMDRYKAFLSSPLAQ